MRSMATEMPDRRTFLSGAIAAALPANSGWADVGSPQYLSAARTQNGLHHLVGLDEDIQKVFSVALPSRGHAAACHPDRPEAVVFARRPGRYAIVLDCLTGTVLAQLPANTERHFYGHGVFSQDGSRLYTTENAYELGEGRIGVWAADDGYRRVGEMWSGGIGPHDIKLLSASGILVVANGGIDTHPESGRTKLNLPTMQSNLTYLSVHGEILEQVETEPELRLNSIRHLDVRSDDLVAFACQWQADPFFDLMLQGTHRRGETLSWLALGRADRTPTYAGSIAFSRNGMRIGVTYPRSGGLADWRLGDPCPGGWHDLKDACGIAMRRSGFLVSSGTGTVALLLENQWLRELHASTLSWDNHLITIR